MRELLRHFIVISAEVASYASDRREADTEALRALLREAPQPFREVDGVYKGFAERSFAVFLNDEFTTRVQEIEGLARLGAAFGQECVLWVTGDRDAYLIDCQTDTQTFLGQWRETTDPRVMGDRDHTHYLDQSGGHHYAWVA